MMFIYRPRDPLRVRQPGLHELFSVCPTGTEQSHGHSRTVLFKICDRNLALEPATGQEKKGVQAGADGTLDGVGGHNHQPGQKGKER